MLVLKDFCFVKCQIQTYVKIQNSMFTPKITKERKILRTEIAKTHPGAKPKDIFDILVSDKAPVITFKTIAQYCEKPEIDTDHLMNIFGPYGVNDPFVSLPQWTEFLNDDFADYENGIHYGEHMTEKQNFILLKFMGILRTKFGGSMASRWNAALARNPPNASNTTLRVSALCRIFRDTNLPFNPEEFVEAIFAFYDDKLETLTFNQFSQLFAAYP